MRASAPFLLAGMMWSVSMTALAAREATNDPRAVYEAGMFVLPELASPKDSYTLLIYSPGEAAPKRLAMPAGVTGARLSTGALPAGEWSWKYVLQSASLHKIEVLAPTDERLSYEELVRYESSALLVWKHQPGVELYRVAISKDRAPSQASKPDWGEPTTVELDDSAINSERSTVHYAQDLKPGDRIRWKAAALGLDKQVLAETEYRTISVDEPRTKQLAGKGLRLQRSDTLSRDVADKPALLGYNSTQRDGSPRTAAYQTEFALIWEGKEPWQETEWFPRASLEARLTSRGGGKDSDALRLRAGAYRVLRQFIVQTNLKYDTERRSGTKKGTVELVVTPTTGPFGRYYPGPTRELTIVDPAGNFKPIAGFPVRMATRGRD
jgi:hypothetical protein